MDYEELKEVIDEYFDIGDSYVYKLTRVKEGFAYGTVTLDDFVEWSEEETEDLARYILKHLNKKD